jgi:hypothetical protein
MRLIDHGTRTIPTLALAGALLTLAPAAFAHGNGHGHAYGHRGRYVAWCPPPPPVVYRECAPRYVVYRPSRVLIVRPQPYVVQSGISGVIGGQFGPVNISAVFGPHARYSSYRYGCNFCDANFVSFGAYENHVERCGYRPANVRIEAHAWGDDGYDDDDYDGR